MTAERATLPDNRRTAARMVWIIVRRELRDTLRDWRLVTPVVILTLIFPWLMNWTARVAINFVQQRNATIIGERIIPFLLMIVGFFPISFSLIIALETFVGEKERRSIEPLLSMPITDMELYLSKMIAATALPLLGSILGIVVYLGGLYFSIGYLPPPDLLVQIFVLNVISALVMVAGAVVISSQTTSVRAANLLASFIIVPMALLIQAESVIMFWGFLETLWLIALGLVVVMLILVRMGIKTFNREEILGREIDELNLRRVGSLLRYFFVRPPAPGIAPAPAAEGRTPRQVLRWVWRVYRHDLPLLLRRNWMAVAVVLIMVTAAFAIGWGYVEKYPLPPGVLRLENLSQQDLESFSQIDFLPTLATGSIFWHNLRVLLLAALAAVISLGVFAILMLMIPLGLVGFFAGQIAWLGYDPLLFLATFVLPHGIFEIPAAILATAFALRVGASITAPREGLTVGEGLIAAVAEFGKVLIFAVVPLLLIAAWIEAHLTPRLVLWVYGG